MSSTIPTPVRENRNTQDLRNELNQLKEEMRRFRDTLESQKIISERMLRNVIGKRASSIMTFVKFQAFVALPLCAICFLPITFHMGTWLFYAATLLMVALSTATNYFINRPTDTAHASLVDILEHLICQKRRRMLHEAIGIVVVTAWLIWFCQITSAHFGEDLILPAVMGGVIGSIIGISIFFHQQKGIDDSIRDIRLMKEDDTLS